MAEAPTRQRTRIVATLGPASEDPSLIRRLVEAGMDVARFNLSHGERGEHEARLRAVREAARACGTPVAVLADLQGPKIRLGDFAGGSDEWTAGAAVTITTDEHPLGDASRVGCTYGALHEDLAPGDAILVDDGLLRLRVDRIDGRDIACTVEEGGTVRSAKGMNLPGVDIRAPVLSAKDHEDLVWALDEGVDLVALSFVRSADDVTTLRDVCAKASHPPAIIAKIERAEAVDDIDGILAAADGIMVARGDLGTEIGHHRLPAVQKQLLRRAAEAGRLAITATQMLESMVDHPVPTRAEASDVANAVYDGSDAVMLSAETAVGIAPVRAVGQMATICREAERGEWRRWWPPDPVRCDVERRDLALARAAVDLAGALPAQVILVLCDDDIDLRLLPILGKLRSPVPVCVTCRAETLWRRLAAVWGVVPLLVDGTDPEEDGGCMFCRLVESGVAAVGETAVVLEGAGVAGPTAVSVRRITR